MSDAALRTITTNIPARLDRLPWSGWHWRILIGLGTVWILDGLEVTIVGNVTARLAEPGSGIHITAQQVSGYGAALYILGCCCGSLFFGWLTDRLGRKKLFMLTLAIYLAAAAMTGLATEAWWFLLFRFITGLGIGGEYAAINSAIDELIPSAHRGRIDIIVNGSFWLGAVFGALLSIPALDTKLLPENLGWRLTFFLGVVLGLLILLVRKNVPESPRWMLIHGHDEAAEKVVDGIEQHVTHGNVDELPEATDTLTIHQRHSIGFGSIVHTMVKKYPKRSILGLSLFIGQAFLYNAITFGYATILATFFKIPSGLTGYYYVAIALGNFIGAMVLAPLFDKWGRRPMISGSYIVSALALFVTAWLFATGILTALTLTACWCFVLFFASAGASSAYLTVSEVFPMETRALAIAFFYSVGTAVGGISGPLIFASLVETGSTSATAIGFAIGAACMLAAGCVELLLGPETAQQSLEDIAQPLTSASPDDADSTDANADADES